MGTQIKSQELGIDLSLVSIQLMSPASGDLESLLNSKPRLKCFHSINVPSEWGRNYQGNPVVLVVPVSIQLMSPASGDITLNPLKEMDILRQFPFN